jgi:hypothetical protein
VAWALAAYGAAKGGGGLALAMALAAPVAILGIDAATGAHGASVPRYATVSAASLMVAAAVGLARIPAPWLAIPLALMLGCEADGVRRYRSTVSKNGDFAGAARLMTAAGCDARDLVVCALAWKQDVIELNYHLAGDPSEMLIEGGGDLAAFERPWRSVYIVAVADRAKAAAQIAAVAAERFPRCERRDLEGVILYRLTRDGP